MTHIDAFTGEELAGKAVILNTTEGPEFVSADSLGALLTLYGSLTARVEELEDRVRELTSDRGPEPTPGDVAEPAPEQGATVEAVQGPTTVTVVEAVPASTRKAATSTRKAAK